jgi:hypothetical protein
MQPTPLKQKSPIRTFSLFGKTPTRTVPILKQAKAEYAKLTSRVNCREWQFYKPYPTMMAV